MKFELLWLTLGFVIGMEVGLSMMARRIKDMSEGLRKILGGKK